VVACDDAVIPRQKRIQRHSRDFDCKCQRHGVRPGQVGQNNKVAVCACFPPKVHDEPETRQSRSARRPIETTSYAVYAVGQSSATVGVE
jgi:hypothetical protein